MRRQQTKPNAMGRTVNMNGQHQSVDENQINDLSEQLGERLLRDQRFITTAESCTGGLIAGAITSVAGSSAWFEQGAVTYSNEAKQTLLGVEKSVLEQHGAVSEACVRAMAAGALQGADADVAVSVSGIAGPGGATAGKPVGTVWIGWAIRRPGASGPDAGGIVPECEITLDAEVHTFSGNRRFVRHQAVLQALRGTIRRIDDIYKAGLPQQ